VNNASLANKVRFSDPKFVDQAQIVTSVRSAVLLTEISFQLASALKTLHKWAEAAHLNFEIDIANARTSKKRGRIKKEYRLFIEGMFGTDETLQLLIATDPGSLRDQLEGLKLASAMQLARFAKKKDEGYYSCYGQLTTDLQSKTEALHGECTHEERSLWKYVSSIVAKEYKSPLYDNFSKGD
jgi:hypothetical protein